MNMNGVLIPLDDSFELHWAAKHQNEFSGNMVRNRLTSLLYEARIGILFMVCL